MAMINRATRKILFRLIGVGISVLVVIVVLEALIGNQKNVSTFHGPEGEVAFWHKISWMVKPNQERVDKAKAVSYDGRHGKYLSEALVDLFGFSSKCYGTGADDNENGSGSSSVIILHSSPKKIALRDKIRETWASPEECRKHGVLLRFVTGRPIDAGEVELLTEESKKHGDILVGNFTDNVRSTTLKSLLGLRWTMAFCSGIDYIIEGRDNTFMWLDKLPNVLRTFHKEENRKFILGARSNSSRIVHDELSRFYVGNAVLNREFYPFYCSLQAGFIMPFSLAAKHYEYAWSTPTLVPFADALLGLNAEEYGWDVRHSHRFSLTQLDGDDACALSSKFTALAPKKFKNIDTIWEQLHDRMYMKECDSPDLDIIYAGKVVDNAKYFKTVLKTVKESPDMTCADQDVFMIVLISSHPARKNARDTIRGTWGNKIFLKSLPRRVKVYFLIGQPDPSNLALRLTLDEEHEQNRDLLEGNFLDSFKNLTLKHMFGLTWTTDHCSNAKYFFKGDDDVFVNLRNVVDLLVGMNNHGKGLRELYLGDGGREYRNRDKNSKYHVASEEYDGKVFPRYCVGGGYVLSLDLVVRILQEALRTPMLSSRDDVFVGILLKKLQVPLVYNDGFLYTMGPTDTCSLRDKTFMVMHIHDNVEGLAQIWRNFVKADVQC